MNYCEVDAVTLTNPYEDNAIELDGRNEYQRVISLVRVQPNKSNNLDDIFGIIMKKAKDKSTTNHTEAVTQQDLYKLDSFGTALAW